MRTRRQLCSGPAFLPVAAVVDALTHAVEAYVSRKANPFSDGLALNALVRAGADGVGRVDHGTA
ncbi:iron-containing alcohol dehydrogenase [Streptomyces puniciscabiei]|uniref:iron-containing alcohol dehydrogenase n=1 Tax=Streptomyces puniciscabiei TaxID=164348 RepID=UPI0018FE407E